MAKNTEIHYADHTANFWWGCQKVSPGCEKCFAEAFARRLGKKLWGSPQTSMRERKKAIWKDILTWDRDAQIAGERHMVFVMTMGDFLEDHPALELPRRDAMKIISVLKASDIMIFTKRPENYRLLDLWLPRFPKNVWMMASVENQEFADRRIPDLLKIPCSIHGISVAPMLGPIDIRRWLEPESSLGIDWVICEGESGAGARTLNLSCVRDLYDQCVEHSVPFYMKQDSGLYPGRQGRIPGYIWSCKQIPRA